MWQWHNQWLDKTRVFFEQTKLLISEQNGYLLFQHNGGNQNIEITVEEDQRPEQLERDPFDAIDDFRPAGVPFNGKLIFSNTNYTFFKSVALKGTVMQIEKTLINDRLRVSKVPYLLKWAPGALI